MTPALGRSEVIRYVQMKKDKRSPFLNRMDASLTRLRICLRSKAFAKVASLDQGEDDDVRPWIRGFVQKHGVKDAQILLSGVGMLTAKY
jgi:hypothetical protein